MSIALGATGVATTIVGVGDEQTVLQEVFAYSVFM
jgi:hypothetical protein